MITRLEISARNKPEAGGVRVTGGFNSRDFLFKILNDFRKIGRALEERHDD